MSEEIRDIKESISFIAETQRIMSDNMLLQQQQFNEFQQTLQFSLQESERRFNASQNRLEAILLNQQRQMQLSEERSARMIERQNEADQRFNVLLQELRHTNQRVDRLEQA